jgi:hypothetical protein
VARKPRGVVGIELDLVALIGGTIGSTTGRQRHGDQIPDLHELDHEHRLGPPSGPTDRC